MLGVYWFCLEMMSWQIGTLRFVLGRPCHKGFPTSPGADIWFAAVVSVQAPHEHAHARHECKCARSADTLCLGGFVVLAAPP